MSIVSLEDALFLASLPYKRSLYKGGGWTISPENSDFNRWVNFIFSKDEVKVARENAKSTLYNVHPEDTYRTIWDDSYPTLLTQIYDPPAVLFFRGECPDFQKPCVSIVGTRNMDRCIFFALTDLLRNVQDTNIVSGFARGVDANVHFLSTLNRNHTLAVLGSGLSHIGPRSNAFLPKQIRAKNTAFTFVTEFPHNYMGAKWNFPRRNRIIAGLSPRTIVMQAPENSGALITARFALDEGRDLYVFDHPILGNRNAGARSFLSDGAYLIEIETFVRSLVHKDAKDSLSHWVRGRYKKVALDWYLDTEIFYKGLARVTESK